MQGRCGHTIELKLAVYGLFSQLQLQYSGLPKKLKTTCTQLKTTGWL